MGSRLFAHVVTSAFVAGLVVLSMPVGSFAQQCGDLDASGKVSAADALAVLKAAVGQPVELVCGGPEQCTVCEIDAVKVGGACWYWGNGGRDCDEVCSDVGLAYDDATKTYAGSEGTTAQCDEVWDALGQEGFSVQYNGICNFALGCAFDRNIGESKRIRCTQETTSSASETKIERACACK